MFLSVYMPGYKRIADTMLKLLCETETFAYFLNWFSKGSRKKIGLFLVARPLKGEGKGLATKKKYRFLKL